MNDKDLVKIKEVKFSADEKSFKGDVQFEAPPELIMAFCDEIIKLLEKNKATNFVEMRLRRPKDLEGFIVTFQKEAGKSPAELKREVEEKLSELENKYLQLELQYRNLENTISQKGI